MGYIILSIDEKYLFVLFVHHIEIAQTMVSLVTFMNYFLYTFFYHIQIVTNVLTNGVVNYSIWFG
jgi:hypothetical protein